MSCSQCSLCLWIVYYCCALFVFALCLVPSVALSLDCLLLLCFVCLRFVSCSQCSLCLWIVFDFCALFVFALCLVPSVPCVSGLSLISVLCLSSLCVLVPVLLVSLDCLLLLCFVCLRFVSCSQCSLCLWIVFDFCALFVFALCLGPSVACVSGLSIAVLCLSSLCVLFPVFLVSLDCLLLLCFVCLRFVSCSQCSLCLWIVYYCCALFVFAFCLVPSVPCVSGLSLISVLCLSSLCVLFPVFLVSLDCL